MIPWKRLSGRNLIDGVTPAGRRLNDNVSCHYVSFQKTMKI